MTTAEPAIVTIFEFEREAFRAALTERVLELPELTAAPQVFIDTWLPMIVSGATDGFAADIEATATSQIRVRQRWTVQRFIGEGRMLGVAASIRVWLEAHAA